jgi:ABC-type multidrug transport system fused ATPase/permease subunit
MHTIYAIKTKCNNLYIFQNKYVFLKIIIEHKRFTLSHFLASQPKHFTYPTRFVNHNLGTMHYNYICIYFFVRFKVLTAANMMFRIVFWDVLSCKMIVDRRFRGAYCLHHHPWTYIFLFTGITVPRAWPEKGDIVFEEVSLRYDASRGPVISNLNLHIPPGQKVNFVVFHCSMMLVALLWATVIYYWCDVFCK